MQSLKIRLLAMLHGGFTWLGISFALNALSHALLAVAAWSMATVGWAVRYGRWFGRPRLDGRPG